MIVYIFTSPPIGERSRPIVMTVSVCLRPLSPEPHVRSSPNFYASYLCLWLEVFLWRRCDTLCTSGFMDDVMVVDNGQEWAAQ